MRWTRTDSILISKVHEGKKVGWWREKDFVGTKENQLNEWNDGWLLDVGWGFAPSDNKL